MIGDVPKFFLMNSCSMGFLILSTMFIPLSKIFLLESIHPPTNLLLLFILNYGISYLLQKGRGDCASLFKADLVFTFALGLHGDFFGRDLAYWCDDVGGFGVAGKTGEEAGHYYNNFRNIRGLGGWIDGNVCMGRKNNYMVGFWGGVTRFTKGI
jgi:hypothetical protein